MEPTVCFLQFVLDPELADVVSNPESVKNDGNSVCNNSLTMYVIYGNPSISSSTTVNSLGICKGCRGVNHWEGSKAFARASLLSSMLCSAQIGNVERIRVYRGRSWDCSSEVAWTSGSSDINCGRVSNVLRKNGSFLAILSHLSASRTDWGRV